MNAVVSTLDLLLKKKGRESGVGDWGVAMRNVKARMREFTAEQIEQAVAWGFEDRFNRVRLLGHGVTSLQWVLGAWIDAGRPPVSEARPAPSARNSLYLKANELDDA